MNVSGVALSGLNQAQAALESVVRRVSGQNGGDDTVSLSADAVALIQAKNSFSANIGVLKVADDLEKATLSLFE